ncbi:MAG: hypothetical protein GPJ05_22305 [Microcystis aeruginosa G13-10]|nr:hypothetical protein [Microcystis aeruginosa G13-10]
MIEEIRQKVRQNQFEFSQHAVNQSILRQIIHIHCSYPSRPLLKIITLYEPDPNLWIDFKSRRTPDVN